MKRIYCKLLLIKDTWHVLDVWSKYILILFCGKAYRKSFKNNRDLILRTGGFPGGSDVKVSACNAGDLGSIPGWGRSPGEGNGNPLQYSCLENPMDGGAWWATVHGVAKSWTRLSDFTFTLLYVYIHIYSLLHIYIYIYTYIYIWKEGIKEGMNIHMYPFPFLLSI